MSGDRGNLDEREAHPPRRLRKLGPCSFFSRIYDDEQFNLVRVAIAESWQRSKVVA